MKPLRADAARNRAMLLAVAAEEYDARGVEVSVADIARRAGVGKGTVFRHFPTKGELIDAIVRDRIEALNLTAEGLLAGLDAGVDAGLNTGVDPGTDAGAALLAFMTEAVRRQRQRDLSFLQGAATLNDETLAAQQRMGALLEQLVTRAREQGAIRSDVDGTDVMLLLCAPNHVASYAPDASPDLWQRYLAILFDGLRPAGAHPLPPR